MPATTTHDIVTFQPWTMPPGRDVGHDPRSAYVERFWLSTLGPSATWIIRRIADHLDDSPDGAAVNLNDLAQSVGLSFARGVDSPFGKALHRCSMFNLIRPNGSGYDVKRRIPDLTTRQLDRMHQRLRRDHDEWIQRTWTTDVSAIEHQLVSAGVDRRVAPIAAENVITPTSS